MFQRTKRFLTKDFGYIPIGLNETGRNFRKLYLPVQIILIALLYWYYSHANTAILVGIIVCTAYLFALSIYFGFIKRAIPTIVSGSFSWEGPSMYYGPLAVFWASAYMATNCLFIYWCVVRHP